MFACSYNDVADICILGMTGEAALEVPWMKDFEGRGVMPLRLVGWKSVLTIDALSLCKDLGKKEMEKQASPVS
jgi:hypothetical protein